MAKKETAKKTTTKKSSENKEDILDESVKINVEEISKAIDDIDTNIDLEPIEKEIEEKMEKAMEPISEVVENLDELNKSQEILASKIQNEPENAKEIIEKEIEKAKELHKKTAEALGSAKKINSANRKPDVTSWWNGMGFSF